MKILDYDFRTFSYLNKKGYDLCYAMVFNTVNSAVKDCSCPVYAYLFDFEVKLYINLCEQHFMLFSAESLMGDSVIIYHEDKYKLNNILNLY